MFRKILFTVVIGLASTLIKAQSKPEAYQLGVEGVLKVDAGQYKEGITLLKQARNLEPQEYDYSFEIGKAYLKSGNPRKAEKYLYQLQYHSNVQADLYVLLSRCYVELEQLKKSPDPDNKRAMDALRYGIQKLPADGVLYLELAQRNLEKEKRLEALSVLEKGIRNAPDFAENYFWASKLLLASGNHLWSWIYSETCYNQTDDLDLRRSAALIITESTEKVFAKGWQSDPEKLDQEIRFILTEKCNAHSDNTFDHQLLRRNCLIENWEHNRFGVDVFFKRLSTIREKGFSEAYVWSILQESDKEAFLKWLPENAERFDAYRNWSYWNPLLVKKSIDRLSE